MGSPALSRVTARIWSEKLTSRTGQLEQMVTRTASARDLARQSSSSARVTTDCSLYGAQMRLVAAERFHGSKSSAIRLGGPQRAISSMSSVGTDLAASAG